MNQKQYKAAVEALLFAHGEPVTAQRLADTLGSPTSEVEMALDALRERYERADSGLCLLHLDERWQLATKQEYGQFIKRILDTRRNTPLSPAAMETLTIVAYNQPVSRSFIEQVRGVDSSSSVSSLMEKGLIEEAGRMDLPGRPVAFRTTDTFLRTFGLASLRDLPPIHTGAGESAPEQTQTPPASAPSRQDEQLHFDQF
jgi:segregation and condensation protein B